MNKLFNSNGHYSRSNCKLRIITPSDKHNRDKSSVNCDLLLKLNLSVNFFFRVVWLHTMWSRYFLDQEICKQHQTTLHSTKTLEMSLNYRVLECQTTFCSFYRRLSVHARVPRGCLTCLRCCTCCLGSNNSRKCLFFTASTVHLLTTNMTPWLF